MNIFWLIKGIPDFENISPLIFRAKKFAPDIKLFVAFNSPDLEKNIFLIEGLNRLTSFININITDLSNYTNNDLNNYINSNSISTMIFDWGSGYPTSILGHVKWLFSNKKTSLRSKLIKCGKRNNINLLCLPHAISMHTSPSIKPQKLVRRIANFITFSNIIEDYSDRKIFNKLLFYNEIQCTNYRNFYNLASSNLGLVQLYKYDKEWMNFFYNKKTITNKNIVFSIPKLHNKINIRYIINTLEFLEKYSYQHSSQIICAFHPRVDINSLPKKLLRIISKDIFEICVEPFSNIIYKTNMLLDAGSSILLDGLAHEIPVAYLSYLDNNKIIKIHDNNFYDIHKIKDLNNFLEVTSIKDQFSLPNAFKDGNRLGINELFPKYNS